MIIQNPPSPEIRIEVWQASVVSLAFWIGGDHRHESLRIRSDAQKCVSPRGRSKMASPSRYKQVFWAFQAVSMLGHFWTIFCRNIGLWVGESAMPNMSTKIWRCIFLVKLKFWGVCYPVRGEAATKGGRDGKSYKLFGDVLQCLGGHDLKNSDWA